MVRNEAIGAKRSRVQIITEGYNPRTIGTEALRTHGNGQEVCVDTALEVFSTNRKKH